LNLKPLKRGSRVAVVSPSGPVLPEHIAYGLETLADWGLEVDVIEAYARDSGYLAGSDSLRISALHRAFSGEYEAIFCSRGGYGATRIIGDLQPASNPWLIGFSDITALHLRFWDSLPCVHGPVLKSFQTQPDGTASLRRLLFDEPTQRRFECTPVSAGAAQGRLLAGNLSVLVSCLDAPWFPSLDGRVLLVEDVGEVDYRLDRLFTSLRLSQKGRGLAGLILGDFNACAGVYVDETSIPDFLKRLAREFNIPAVSGFPSGHMDRNEPVRLGSMARIDGKTGIVEIE
jgi:muramoyltetrapeptide carboxypeptidase